MREICARFQRFQMQGGLKQLFFMPPLTPFVVGAVGERKKLLLKDGNNNCG